MPSIIYELGPGMPLFYHRRASTILPTSLVYDSRVPITVLDAPYFRNNGRRTPRGASTPDSYALRSRPFHLERVVAQPTKVVWLRETKKSYSLKRLAS